MNSRFLSVMFVLLTVVACNQNPQTDPDFDPADAFSPSSEALPEDAVEVSRSEFVALRHSASFHSLGKRQRQQDEANAAVQAQADNLEVNAFLELHPNLKPIVGTEPVSAEVQPLGDGNNLLGVNTLDGLLNFITLGKRARYHEFASSLRLFHKRTNQLAVYRNLYQALEETDRLNYPQPNTLGSLTDEALEALLKSLSRNWGNLIHVINANTAPPANFVSDPNLEEGKGQGSDRTRSTGCHQFSKKGLHANFWWALKYFTTSVKDQGHRGSCIAFSSTAAIESGVALKFNRYVNLSEQFLYNAMKMLWGPKDYGDGGAGTNVWQHLLNDQYLLPFEEQWNYNPSLERIDTGVGYQKSCVNYLEDCSNTTHQGKKVCVFVDTVRYCGFSTPGNPNNHGFRIKEIQSIWDASDPEASLGTLLLYLKTANPVQFGITVTNSFTHPDANGFVHVVPGSIEPSLGGHGILATGFVTNTQLKDILPNATPGEGGGYVILKNSWGCGFADAGYVYVSFDWIKTYGTGGIAVTAMQ